MFDLKDGGMILTEVYSQKSHKQGQEAQGFLRELEGTLLAVLRSLGPPKLPSGSSMGTLLCI